MSVRSLVVTCVLCAVCSAPAQAGTFRAGEFGKGGDIGLTYLSLPGETNAVRASYDQKTRTFVLTDDGASVVAAEPGLSPETPGASDWCTFELRRVTCHLPAHGAGECCVRNTELWAALGDGGDSATVSGDFTAWWLHGGPGNDTLRGLVTTPYMWTGHLYGSAGDDTLRAGPGDQRLDGGPGADVIDGGEGTLDQVTWGETMAGVETPVVSFGSLLLREPEQTEGVHVRLDGYRNDGHQRGAEGDNVINVENVVGTPFADLIVGGPADERLEGGEGDDRITGGAGRDHVSGDWGTNWLDLRDGEADTYVCGSLDTVLADPIDTRPFQTAGCDGLVGG